MSEVKKDDNVGRMLDNIQPRTIEVIRRDGNAAEVLLIPVGMKAESVKKYIDENRDLPERRTGTEKVDRLQSFIELTNRFKDDGSVIFARANIEDNTVHAEMTAVLDYHPVSSDYKHARHGAHRVYYPFPISKEFQFWLRNNGEAMGQTDFALLLEERVNEMVVADDLDRAAIPNLSPKFAEPLEMLELSRNLEIYSQESVTQAGKLSSGEREIKFTAVHNGADGKPISIPDFFVLRLPIFEGEAPVRIMARLRYRKAGSGVVWFYDLYRVDRVFQTAFDIALVAVENQTGLPLFIGAPAK